MDLRKELTHFFLDREQVERLKELVQFLFLLRAQGVFDQETAVGSDREVVLTNHPAAVSNSLDEFLRGQKEVIKDRQELVVMIERVHRTLPLQSPVPNHLSYDRPVFLLYITTIIGVVGS